MLEGNIKAVLIDTMEMYDDLCIIFISINLFLIVFFYIYLILMTKLKEKLK